MIFTVRRALMAFVALTLVGAVCAVPIPGLEDGEKPTPRRRPTLHRAAAGSGSGLGRSGSVKNKATAKKGHCRRGKDAEMCAVDNAPKFKMDGRCKGVKKTTHYHHYVYHRTPHHSPGHSPPPERRALDGVHTLARRADDTYMKLSETEYGRHEKSQIACARGEGASSEASVYAVTDWMGKTPPGIGYVVKMSEDPISSQEIDAVKACKRYVAHGLNSKGEGEGYFSLIMHRGKGAPVGGHPDYKDESKREAFLEDLLPSAVSTLLHFAKTYSWLHNDPHVQNVFMDPNGMKVEDLIDFGAGIFASGKGAKLPKDKGFAEFTTDEAEIERVIRIFWQMKAK